jgi:dolichyl-phosphate beta-glucosyltransferase
MKLSIIIPAYNEEDRIVHTLTETLAYLDRQPYETEIRVISDGSTDRTGSVVENFSSTAGTRIYFHEYHPNRGKGYAVRYGMLKGEAAVVMFMDADYSVPMSAVEAGLQLIDAGCDIAIASRAIDGAKISHHQNRARELSARIYTLVQNRYLSMDYPDTQCGFKLFRRKAARALFSKQRLDSVIFDPEILWLAKRQGLKVGQFPVKWTHQEDSRIQYDNLRKSLFVFQELFRIKFVHRN